MLNAIVATQSQSNYDATLRRIRARAATGPAGPVDMASTAMAMAARFPTSVSSRKPN
jgi:hypothetical protein